MMDNKKLLLKKKRKKLSNSIFQKEIKASVLTGAFFCAKYFVQRAILIKLQICNVLRA